MRLCLKSRVGPNLQNQPEADKGVRVQDHPQSTTPLTAARRARRTATRLALGAGAVTAATVLGTAGPAAAQSAPAPHPTAAKAKAQPPSKAKPAKSRTTAPPARHQAALAGGRTSENWSGYSQSSGEVGRPVTSVSGSWQVPTSSQQVRGRSEAASDWIGIGGGRSSSKAGSAKSDPTLVQAGVTSTLGHSGSAAHYTWIETLPGDAVATPLQARSGDRITVAISRSGTDRWRVRLDNRSSGHHWTTTVRYHSAMRSGSWISERPTIGGADTNLPKRTALTYSAATVNGHPTRFRPSQRITMTDHGRRIATPTAAEGNGSSFTICSHSTRC
jgi:hypothetical protein